MTGGRQLETFRTTLDRASSSYVVTAPITVGEQFMVVARARTRAGGVPLISMARLNTVLLDTRQVTTAFSADGQLSLTVPAGALPSGRWLVFGPAEAPAPRGRVLVREPRLIASGVSGERLAQRGILRFVLPDPQEGGAPPPFDPATARIERFDPRRERWEPQRSRFEPVPLSGGLFLETDRLGIYAVTARRR